MECEYLTRVREEGKKAYGVAYVKAGSVWGMISSTKDFYGPSRVVNARAAARGYCVRHFRTFVARHAESNDTFTMTISHE